MTNPFAGPMQPVPQLAPSPAIPVPPVSTSTEVAPVGSAEGVRALTLALRQIAALEQWRDAIHAVRTQRGA